MPRHGAIIFSDLVGKLEAVLVTCERCGRNGRYRLQSLIAERGSEAKIVDWLDELTADCSTKQTSNWADRCAARCQDLPKVL